MAACRSQPCACSQGDDTVSGALVETVAEMHGLEVPLIQAIVHIESGGDPWAWNPEPRYRYFWDVRNKRPFRTLHALELESKMPPKDFYDLRGFRGVDADQEWWGQQASWGLMQLMGGLARELGYAGAYLSSLCDPGTNLQLGCRHLRALLDWADRGNIAEPVTWNAVAAYNGGRGGWSWPGPQAYASKVRIEYDRLTEGRS